MGFPPLDKLLDVFQNPPLTRQQRQHQANDPLSSSPDRVIQSARDKPLPILEITGATACSGKTQILYYLVSVSLLPREYKDKVLGKGHAVVLLDISSKFSILRLYEVMQSRINSIFQVNSITLTEQELSTLICDSLTHLHVFRPQSSSSFLATLESMSSYLLAQPSNHFSTNRQLGLLAINDISSFLWQDRLDADEKVGMLAANHTEKANNGLFIQHYRSIVSILRDLQHRFACTIIATNVGMAPISSVSGHRALRPSLPSVWNNFCTVKVVVERDKVTKFGPGLSAEEALKEGPQRWEAVERSGFSGWVNWWDSEGWREEVKEAVKRLVRGGSFSFGVNAQGLMVDDDDNE